MKTLQIIEEIKNGMTGNLESDREYLEEYIYKYSDRKDIRILREIYKLALPLLDDEQKAELDSILDGEAMSLAIEIVDIENAINQGDKDTAFSKLEALVSIIEAECLNKDKNTNYFWFSNEVEVFLYISIFQPTGGIHLYSADYSSVYKIYGDILLEKGRIDDAHAAYKKALEINPMNMDAYFSNMEMYKLKENHRSLFIRAQMGFCYAYKKKDLSRLYEYIGEYMELRKNRLRAYYCYFYAVKFDPEREDLRNAMSRIQNTYKRKIKDPTDDEFFKQFSEMIPAGAHSDVLEALYNSGKYMEEKGMYKRAQQFYAILQSLDEENSSLN